MVEVFKTNVGSCDDARMLIDQIHEKFNDYKANFDLEDCDLILRIECCNAKIAVKSIISLLNQYGFDAEPLADEFALSILR